MLDVDWKKDYQGEFICPSCNLGRLVTAGNYGSKKILRCSNCNKRIYNSVDIRTTQKNRGVNWRRDYKGDFTCPDCEGVKLGLGGRRGQDKQRFNCPSCKRQFPAYVGIEIADPLTGINWKRDYKGEFTCPHCNKNNLNLSGGSVGNRQFYCFGCKKYTHAFVNIKLSNKTSVINWRKDYQGEFVCPKCNAGKLVLVNGNAECKQFKCINCKKSTSAFLAVKLPDPDTGVNWKVDYKGEFICPQCEGIGLKLCGGTKNKQFQCPKCKKYTSAYVKIKSPDWDTGINWQVDYKGEFVCPHCEEKHLQLRGGNGKKRCFECPNCHRVTSASIEIKLPSQSSGINWRSDYKIGEFACPSEICDARKVVLIGNSREGKKCFRCTECDVTTVAWIDLTQRVLSRIAHTSRSITPFCFNNDVWDLRSINLSFDDRDQRYYANFVDIKQVWFRDLSKQYILHSCKQTVPFSTIDGDLTHLRIFSYFLLEVNISGIEQINRDIILSFIIWDKTGDEAKRARLGALKQLFRTGNVQGWFSLDQDIIVDDDYPKKKRSTPDPISSTVQQQIENNLHEIPDPIARMWLIAFFTAMRCSELALLMKNCLVQEGSGWKVVWYRKKTKDKHEVPVSRTIAKLIQDQQAYIQQLWGDNWPYLFCHYQGISDTDPSQPNLQPVRKVIPKHHDPLSKVIRCLIRAKNILDDNQKLAEFTPSLIRPTRLTQLFEQGYDLHVISQWAGHKHQAITAIYYVHTSNELIEKEAGHIQKAFLNTEGKPVLYESLPKSFWENSRAHQLELPGDHINTPIYGYCGLALDQECEKFRACYTCRAHFIAVPQKLPLYKKTRDELRSKESRAKEAGAEVLVEQYQRQAENLDRIIAELEHHHG